MFVPDLVLRGLARVAAPAGRDARLTVLLYHRVLPIADPLLPGEPDAVLFESQIALLARIFNVLPLEAALSKLRRGELPERALSITFDDGYADNLDVAVPILRRHGVVATFFVSTGFLDGGRMMHDTVAETVRRLPDGSIDLDWVGLGHRHLSDTASRLDLTADFVGRVKYLPFSQRRDACDRLGALSPQPLPNNLMLRSSQVPMLQAAGMEVGAHTHDHPILGRIDLDQAREQININRETLAGLLGRAPRLFAYPNGKPGVDYAREHVELVKKAGFDAAVSVSFGTASRDSDHFQVPRFIPWDRDPRKLALRAVTHPLRHRTTPCS